MVIYGILHIASIDSPGGKVDCGELRKGSDKNAETSHGSMEK